jgi:hypothetical protein
VPASTRTTRKATEAYDQVNARILTRKERCVELDQDGARRDLRGRLGVFDENFRSPMVADFPVSPFFAHKENPPSVLQALARGGVDAVVIAAHGRPMPGLGHYLELGSDVIPTPAEMFASTPPKSLALLAC